MSVDSSSAGSRNVDLENLQAKNYWRSNTEQVVYQEKMNHVLIFMMKNRFTLLGPY